MNASLVAQHIKGVDNVTSDALSRIDAGDQFQFNAFVFQDLCEGFGTPTVDRFAT